MGSKAYKVVEEFEEALCEYTKAPYAVTVASCSAAIFLCLQRFKYLNTHVSTISVPKRTYPSVAHAVYHCGLKIRFTDEKWQKRGYYELYPLPIVDSAKLMQKDMYLKGDLMGMMVCLSFHSKKHIKIGRGGAILTENKADAEWFKVARFDGRHQKPLHKDKLAFPGWNEYMLPEQAARGLEMLQFMGNGGVLPPDPYIDLSKYAFYHK